MPPKIKYLDYFILARTTFFLSIHLLSHFKIVSHFTRSLVKTQSTPLTPHYSTLLYQQSSSAYNITVAGIVRIISSIICMTIEDVNRGPFPLNISINKYCSWSILTDCQITLHKIDINLLTM